VSPLDGQMTLVAAAADDEEVRQARIYAAKASGWILASPVRWQTLVAVLHGMAASPDKPDIKRGDVCSWMERQGWDMAMSAQFRFDNSLWATVARYMRAHYPGLRDCLHIRHSHIDLISLPPLPASFHPVRFPARHRGQWIDRGMWQ
jgi:hypothetical protein